jgi:hypothetical protein
MEHDDLPRNAIEHHWSLSQSVRSLSLALWSPMHVLISQISSQTRLLTRPIIKYANEKPFVRVDSLNYTAYQPSLRHYQQSTWIQLDNSNVHLSNTNQLLDVMQGFLRKSALVKQDLSLVQSATYLY